MARITSDVIGDLGILSGRDPLSATTNGSLPATPLLMFKSIEVSDLSRYRSVSRNEIIHHHAASLFQLLARSNEPIWC